MPDSAFGDLWGLRNTGQNAGLAGADIDVLGAWQRSEGLGVTVAVVDTGINADHEDLTGQLASTKAELEGVPGIDDDGNGYVDDVKGWDFLGRDNVAQDGSGHGTHVAGTLAAAGGNGLGVVGVAPRAKVLPLRVLGDDGKGTMSAVASAFDYAGDLGVRVVNASVGGAYSAAVRTAIAAHPDTLYVVAAGNDTLDADTASGAFPCALPEPNVVCVGATDNRDALARLLELRSDRGRSVRARRQHRLDEQGRGQRLRIDERHLDGGTARVRSGRARTRCRPGGLDGRAAPGAAERGRRQAGAGWAVGDRRPVEREPRRDGRSSHPEPRRRPRRPRHRTPAARRPRARAPVATPTPAASECDAGRRCCRRSSSAARCGRSRAG